MAVLPSTANLVRQRCADSRNYPGRPGHRQLSARVKLPMHSFETLLVDVGINLGCGNVGMAQHLLDDTQVSPVSEQVRREAMPQKMRINVLFQAAVSRVLLNDLPNPRRRKFCASLGKKNLTTAARFHKFWSLAREICCQGFTGFAADGHQ